MKDSRDMSPPRWATRLLVWYCKQALLEDLEGDLYEYFQRNVTRVGPRWARAIYVLDVFKFFRLYTVRKPEFVDLLIHWIMIGSYIKTSGRVIIRNRLFSFINIIGLAISMAVGLMMIALLSDMRRYDKFHENYDRIHRVISKPTYLDREANNYYASTSLRAGQAIQESVPGIENMAILYRGFKGDMKSGDKTVPLSGHWANESFFKVFTFPMISGDPSTALKEPYSIVLTETSATKLFGRTDVLGKAVILPGNTTEPEFVVTGVVRDVPRFSHIKFDMLASLSTRAIHEQILPWEMLWTNIFSGYVYLLLPKGTDLQNLQKNLNALSAKENQTVKNTTIRLSLQPLSKIALGDDLINSIGPVMVSSNVWMIGILSAIVILSACFNYTNLSVARSLRRSREVGIRKVVGALKSHIVGQFVVEAVIIALCALVFSFVLFVLFKPHFLSLNDQYAQMLVLNLSPELILYFIGFAVMVGVAAGFFPAIFFARVNAIRVLKNISAVLVFRRVTMRKALIVVQFTISLMFIAATIIGYKHYKHLLAIDLGFETENVVNIRLFDNKADVLMKELPEIPEIQLLSASSTITGVGNYERTNMKYRDPLDSAAVYFASIDEHYLPLHGHTFLAGRNFIARPDSATESGVIVNEQVLKRFNIGEQEPLNAVGEIVTVNTRQVQIIGVLKDFYYGKSDSEIKEFIFRQNSYDLQYLNAKIASTDWPATLDKIERAWKKIDNIHPLEATFYDDQIEDSYRSFSARIKVIGALSFLAICIASFGLLGMVVFTTETRLKEISIRKVMGASEGSLVFLLSKGFLVLLLMAGLIALPATQFFFARYALDEHAINAPIAWNELISGVMVVMAVAFLMIGTQTLKAARSNPANVLKNE
jgi:putative ABC transport system permease protein